MSARFKDFSPLGQTLRRVRIADRALSDGGKKVWHQGAQGTEVISFVDGQGNATRQECYLGGEVVVWQPDVPISTGTVEDQTSGGDTIEPHDRASASAILAACALLDGYAGDDRYLHHLRAVLRLAADHLPTAGLEGQALSTLRRVTADQPAVGVKPPQAQTARNRVVSWLIVAVLALALGLYFAHR